MKNMLVAMSDQKREAINIVVQLNDYELSFSPPLVPLTSELSLGEILLDWIESFINRGEFIELLGNDKTTKFSQIINQDPLIIELREKISQLIEETCFESIKFFDEFSQYSYLYQVSVNQSFQLFLHGTRRNKSTSPKNFLSEQDAGRRLV